MLFRWSRFILRRWIHVREKRVGKRKIKRASVGMNSKAGRNAEN
jgi:hypothetical protein